MVEDEWYILGTDYDMNISLDVSGDPAEERIEVTLYPIVNGNTLTNNPITLEE